MKFNLERLRDFAKLTRELAVGLRDLTFADNFRSFEKVVTIAATTEEQIRNELPFIPTRYIVVSQEGNGLITKGTTEWSSNFLYLCNNGAASVTATVIFFR